MADRLLATTLRSHVEKFDRWTARAAYLSAVTLPHGLSPAERAEAIQQIKLLSSEVEIAFARFKADMTGQAPNSRIEDLTRSFERLLSMLRR